MRAIVCRNEREGRLLREVCKPRVEVMWPGYTPPWGLAFDSVLVLRGVGRVKGGRGYLRDVVRPLLADSGEWASLEDAR